MNRDSGIFYILIYGEIKKIVTSGVLFMPILFGKSYNFSLFTEFYWRNDIRCRDNGHYGCFVPVESDSGI